MTEPIRVDFAGQPLEFPAGTPPEVIQATVKKLAAQAAPTPQPGGGGRTLSSLITGEQPVESAATRQGRGMNSSVQGAINALQAPTMGFADELAGAGGVLVEKHPIVGPILRRGADYLFGRNKTFPNAPEAPAAPDKPVAETYRDIRDKVRGATEQFREEYPTTALTTSLAAAAPTVLAAPVRAAPLATRAMTLGQKLLQQGKIGTALGATSGLGESKAEDVQGMIEDTAKGAAISGALGSAAQLGGTGVMNVGRNVAQRFSETAAKDKARLMLAEVLAKDAAARGEIVAKAPGEWVAARATNRGPGATIADAAGQNTRQTLDTLATLPGQTKDAVERLITQRQAGRGRVLTQEAARALDVEGKDYLATLGNIVKDKKAASAPFYQALEGQEYRVDKELADLLRRTKAAHGTAEQLIVQEQGRAPMRKLSELRRGEKVAHDDLDTLKKSLYDLEQGAKGEFGKSTAMSQSFASLRRELTAKLDALSPTDKGGSIYKQAREAFAGHAELEDALRTGRTVFKEGDPLVIKEMTQGLSKSERDAFNIGVLQAVREKSGTQAGQTSLLKMWQEPATADRLRDAFDGNYRKFAQAVAKERALKGIESVGRGSQTAARLLGAGEMDASSEALKALASATMSGAAKSPVGVVSALTSGARNVWNRAKTPEEVRNELSKLLLLRGSAAQRELQGLPELIRRRNLAASQAASGVGVGAGVLPRLDQ